MILTELQAATIQNAMVVLNNIEAKVNITFKNGIESYTVLEDNHGAIHIWNTIGGIAHNEEYFTNQDKFFAAYNI